MPLRLISFWSNAVIWIYTDVSSMFDRSEPPVRVYLCTEFVTPGIICSVSFSKTSVETSTVSGKFRTRMPRFMSRSKLSIRGRTSSSMKRETLMPLSLGLSITWFPFISATKSAVKLK